MIDGMVSQIRTISYGYTQAQTIASSWKDLAALMSKKTSF